jgi:hypothetical protein
LNVIRWDGQPITTPGIYAGVPIEDYHGPNLCAGPSISSSGLRTIFNDCPMSYWIESPLNPNRIEPTEKEHFVIGRAAHHLALGEEQFSRYYAVEPETYPDSKTGEAKPWNNNATFARQWREHVTVGEGRTVLARRHLEAIRGMAGLLPWQEGLDDSGLANSAVVRAGALSGLVEHTIIAKDEETGVFLKSRPDALPLDSRQFADFKTTVAVDWDSLRRTLDDFRYDMQAVLASMCRKQAIGEPFDSHAFIFCMKKPPHAVEVVELTEVDLVEASLDIRAALRTFARCIETGRWPGPGGGRADARYIERSEWSRKEAMGRRSFLELELSA